MTFAAVRRRRHRSLLEQFIRTYFGTYFGLARAKSYRASLKYQVDETMRLCGPHLGDLEKTFGTNVRDKLRMLGMSSITSSIRLAHAAGRIRLAILAIAFVSAIYGSVQIADIAFEESALHYQIKSHAAIWGIVLINAILAWMAIAILFAGAMRLLEQHGYPTNFRWNRLIPRLRRTRISIGSIYLRSSWAIHAFPIELAVTALAALFAAETTQGHPLDYAATIFLRLYVLYASITLTVHAVTKYCLPWLLRFSGNLMPPDKSVFLLVLASLTLAPQLTLGATPRKLLIANLAAISRGIETTIPDSIGIPKEISDPSRLGFLRIAHEIRTLNTWVAFPQSTTSEELSKRLSIIGAAIASNKYHYIYPEGQEFKHVAKEALLSRIKSLLRNIVVGLLPAAALATVVAFHAPLSSQVQTSWAVLSVVWLAVSVLASQPDFKERVAATKDMASLVMGGK